MATACRHFWYMRDIIHHTTTTHLSFWDRVKVLIGRPVVVRSEIVVDIHPTAVIIAKKSATASVPPILDLREKGQCPLETKLCDIEFCQRENPCQICTKPTPPPPPERPERAPVLRLIIEGTFVDWLAWLVALLFVIGFLVLISTIV